MKCLREFQRENRNFIKILAQAQPKLFYKNIFILYLPRTFS